MQQSGTLKKRKRRNLTKVNGLGIVPYTAKDDTFDGLGLFLHNPESPSSASQFYQTAGDIRINIRKDTSHSTSNSLRVTRRPEVHLDIDLDDNEYKNHNSPNFQNGQPDMGDRHHFLDTSTKNRLRMLLLLGAFSGAFPWSWNNRHYRVDKWSSKLQKLWNIQWLFVTIQNLGLLGFQLYSFYQRVNGENYTYREVFMMYFSTYWYICAVYFNVNMYIYKEHIRNHINSIFEFNKKYVDKYLIHLTDYKDGGRLLINLSIPTNCSQVFASVALFLVMPHQPWYLFFYIYPKPWYWLIPGAIQEFVMAGQVITSFLLTAWVTIAHTNSVNFWLREIHKNVDSDYTNDEVRDPATALETYRALQVLCASFNDCMSPLAIPLFKLHLFTGIIPCTYVLIRSMNHKFIDEFPGILTYPIGVIDCATAGLSLVSMSAEMFDLAASFVDSWSRTRQKNFRRILLSFPTLRVKVGRFYFITVATTITFFKVTFDYIINCIITFP